MMQAGLVIVLDRSVRLRGALQSFAIVLVIFEKAEDVFVDSI